MTAVSSYGRFGSGQAVRRIEDQPLVTGAGRFTDDQSLPDQAHIVFLRAPHAHAKIVSIDAAPALAMPGVTAVITGQDLDKAGLKSFGVELPFRRPDGSPLAAPPRPMLAVDIVRFAGEAVAAVIADSAAQARDAAEAIEVAVVEAKVMAHGRGVGLQP